MKSQFDGLLEDLDTMTKSMPAGDETGEGDKKIQAAAAEAGVAATGEVDGGGGAETQTDDDSKEAPMTKSFTIKMDDGSEVEAVDGTDLIKALMDRVDGAETSTVKLIKGLMGVITTQATMLKSLSAKVDEFGSKGAGRRAVVSVAEKPAAAAAPASDQTGGMTMQPEEFLTKCLEAQKLGNLSGLDVAQSENRINNGIMPAPHVVQTVADMVAGR